MADLSISGLASGVNTADIVAKLMGLERQPLIRMQDRQNIIKNKESVWKDLNSSLLTLSYKLADLQLSATFSSKTATSSDSTIVSATASSTALNASYTIQVKQLAQADSVISNAIPGFDASVTLSSQLVGFQGGKIFVGGSAIDVTAADTLNSLVTKINAAQTNVKGTVINNRLVLTANKTGLANTLTVGTAGSMAISDGDTDVVTPDSNVLTSLGVYAGAAFNSYLKHAGDATAYIDGVEVISSSNTLTQAVNGLSITLKAVSQTVGSTGNPLQDLKPATLDVAVDTQKISTAIKNFVDQYNSVMKFIDSKMDYNTETKQKGLFFGDSTAVKIEQKLRNLVAAVVPGLASGYNSLAQIGISTTGRETTLTIDQTKLTKALSDAPDTVAQLFGANQALPNNGVATKLSEYVKNLTDFADGEIKGLTSSLNAQIKDITTQMENLQTRIDLRQQNLTTRFNAMEQLIQGYRSQGNSLTNMLTSLPSYSSSSSNS